MIGADGFERENVNPDATNDPRKTAKRKIPKIN